MDVYNDCKCIPGSVYLSSFFVISNVSIQVIVRGEDAGKKEVERESPVFYTIFMLMRSVLGGSLSKK